jgi:hypothetical protein
MAPTSGFPQSFPLEHPPVFDQGFDEADYYHPVKEGIGRRTALFRLNSGQAANAASARLPPDPLRSGRLKEP